MSNGLARAAVRFRPASSRARSGRAWVIVSVSSPFLTVDLTCWSAATTIGASAYLEGDTLAVRPV